MKEIQIQLRHRTQAQKRISLSKKRFNIACWGRQSGKTTFGIDKMIEKPLQGRRGGIYWDILQTYNAAEIAFDRMCRLLFRSEILRKKPNESELCVFLRNEANVFFKSGDKPHNLRAETLDGCIIDECRQQKKEIWSQIVLPMLGRWDGWCDFYSTPNGYDWFYDLYETARTKNPDGEWGTFHAPSSESWWWTEKQITQAKANMSEGEFAQEILAEFRDIHTGKVYKSFGEWNLKSSSPFALDLGTYSPYLPVVIGMDFNVGHMRWTLGQNRGNTWYWAEEIAMNETQTQETTRELIPRLLSLKERGYLRSNPQVILCGDASGNSRSTKATESDYAIICNALTDAGISWSNETPKEDPPVKDRVNTVNARFKAADGTISCWIHPTNCPSLKRDCERVAWKEGAGNVLEKNKDPSLTHSSDSIGYPMHQMTPLILTGGVGKLHIIRPK